MIGLDVGDRRIGIAAADALGLTAQGMPTLWRKKPEGDFAALADVLRERQAKCLVVGLPKNMNGTISDQGLKVQTFVGDFLAYLEKQALPCPTVVYWDERLTTVAATRTLLAADVSRKKRKNVVDQLAAVLILQGYLDRLGHTSGHIRGHTSLAATLDNQEE